ncbi:MAG: hypothetical protein ACE5GV_08725 [Candidatus Scalindua sp.]
METCLPVRFLSVYEHTQVGAHADMRFSNFPLLVQRLGSKAFFREDSNSGISVRAGVDVRHSGRCSSLDEFT